MDWAEEADLHYLLLHLLVGNGNQLDAASTVMTFMINQDYVLMNHSRCSFQQAYLSLGEILLSVILGESG